MKHLRLGIAGLALLTGCAAPLEVASITEIKPAEAGSGFDVYAERRSRGEQVPEFAGDQVLELRTYEDRSGQGRTELAGADCTVKANNFSAEATTPAKVRVPLYRGQSSTLSVSCGKPGYKSRMVEAAPFDSTRNDRYSSGAGGGLVGVAVVAAFDAMSDNSKNDWRYSPVQIVLEPERVAAAN